MGFTKNELILDRVRSLTAHDLETNQIIYRLTSLEDSSLKCTAEGEEITDAIGATITTLYRAKKATYSATNSLLSLDLAAAQFGTQKVVATTTNKITDTIYEIITVPQSATSITLKYKPKNDIKFIYSINKNELGTAYSAGAVASATQFVVNKTTGVITLPTGFATSSEQKVYVEYQYETENAIKIANKTTEFPSSCSIVIYAYFRDRCNDNLLYSGKIICPKAKLNPEQVELALTSTGKHPFELQMSKDYCSEEGDDELFSIIVASDDDTTSANGITLDKSSATIAAEGTTTITATTIPADATVTWTSSNTSVATVSDGTVTGVAAGNAVILATITTGGISYSATCNVVVTA